MTESEALARMIAPGQVRPSKPYRGGVIQILVTSSCDQSCFGCTQGSQLRRKPNHMTPEQYGQALESLRGYWGVVGMFGGNPAVHPQFHEMCGVLRRSWVPKEQRGIWCNNPRSVAHAAEMRDTFNPAYSNLNVHLDRDAYDKFVAGWPEARPVGLTQDSRHSPPFVAMRDVLREECPTCHGPGYLVLMDMDGKELGQEKCSTCKGVGQIYAAAKAWELISNCDINQRWSAGIGVFRGQLRAWFCEVAMAQALLHQDEPDYPDTGLDPTVKAIPDSFFNTWEREMAWWQLPMQSFAGQVRKHCHSCSVPLRGFGELSQAEVGTEQTSRTHVAVFHPKRKDRPVQIVTELEQLGVGRLKDVVRYLQNGGVK